MLKKNLPGNYFSFTKHLLWSCQSNNHTLLLWQKKAQDIFRKLAIEPWIICWQNRQFQNYSGSVMPYITLITLILTVSEMENQYEAIRTVEEVNADLPASDR
jgi:hypothetical protein